MLDRSRSRDRSKTGGAFSPAGLFVTGAQGAWYDPSDFSTLYQNSTGTTPVTAVEQPVGLMLDRSGRGNHALQATSASRPVLRARYNLLTRSEEFDDGAWGKSGLGTGLAPVVTANAAVAPDGTMTADSIVFDRGAGNASGDRSQVTQTITISATGSYTGTVYLKAATAGDVGKQLAFRHVGQAAFLTVTLTADWVRITRAETTATTSGLTFDIVNRGTITADNTVTALVWGAQLQTAADAAATGGAYQRIAAATDYDVSNPVFRPYLAFDGSDDSFGTSAIDFSATDEMTVFAGVTKLSDAALGIVAELAVVSGASNPGSFFLAAPRTAATGDFAFNCGGTAFGTGAVSANSFAAPTTRVMTGIGDISGDVVTLRIDGTQVATSSSDQGTGNFGNYSFYIGRRGGATLPFNGRLYSLAVLGRTATAAEISAMEAWVAGKTGVNLP